MGKFILFDLDDTLYRETDWRSSGLEAVSRIVADRSSSSTEQVLALLQELDAQAHENLFDRLLERVPVDGLGVSELVEGFRYHKPVGVDMFPMARGFLEACPLPTGIVTDGLWGAQLRKVEALRVRELVGPVVITDLLAADRAAWKPSKLPFLTATSALGARPEEGLYVADNPGKDFVAPNELGMRSIQVRHPGQVHSVTPVDAAHAASLSVDGWGELVGALHEFMGD